MINILGPEIFWTTLAAVVAILSLATAIGRGWSYAFPCRFRAHARFYLAPALGLASLTIIASLLGRILPLGNSVVVPWLIILLLVWLLARESHNKQVLSHALLVSVFGIVCGVSLLGPLFSYGAFNAHNDAFTYLTHSNWLQHHAFDEVISTEKVTPLTTQVTLYQQTGLRMGGSFLLGMLQALLNLQWSSEVYPAVMISAIAACCLAIGFPLGQALRQIRRNIRLAILALPAFSFGGLVFGANMGFLPQTIGLALGGGFLFSIGPMLRWVATTNANWQSIGKTALPSMALFTGATFAYSELTPFLLVAVAGSGLILAFRFNAWKNLLQYGGVLLGLSILLLNTELIRVYWALSMQTGAVVGSPVVWSLLGFVAHAFGVHGGAWDMFQWTVPEKAGSLTYAFGFVLLGLTLALVFFGRRQIWLTTISSAIMPVVAALTVFAIGTVYFRYFVPSPFQKGAGQSWSQFKLTDWSHPFVMVLVLLSIASLRPRLRKLFNGIVVALFAIGVVSAALTGLARITLASVGGPMPLMLYYNGLSDLNRFYLKLRDTVFATCPASTPIYLALGGENHKFRQMATLYLYDREVRSDWMDDGYIYTHLSKERRTQELMPGNCVVERNRQDGWLSQGTQIGPFKVGIFDGSGKIRIESVTGAYDRESDGMNWWHWVEHKVTFKLQPLFIPNDATQTKLRFEYGTRGKQTLTLRIIKHDASTQEFLLQTKDNAQAVFDKFIDLPPTEFAEVSIETDGKASQLGERDTRMAAWIIRNVTITPVSP
ncbi:hypothetical protein QZJ86_07730 [Methylomonas montana]|uniref:hypothetical protein n=1 Tax=Methylomonas montana TaxID=3058963 RepID=UPI0026595A92|nr:hypothetical protein [Methylomonas montana]WKJ92022.1 hypothetical protein QZJ86_07730 [Methylomonas montana]